MKACCTQKASLIVMIFMTTSFFFLEIIVGYVTNSMALVADSFHMLSDVVSLFVGFFALKISQEKSERQERNTFGWARAEVLGALVNSVFLVALCFSILVEAMKRIVQPESIEDPILVLIVGSAGLLVNIIGMCIFQGHIGHGHSHGHSHSHGHGHKNGEGKRKQKHSTSSPKLTPKDPVTESGYDNPGQVTDESADRGNNKEVVLTPERLAGRDSLDVIDDRTEDSVSIASLQVTSLPFQPAAGGPEAGNSLSRHSMARYSFRIVVDDSTAGPTLATEGQEDNIVIRSDQMNMKGVYLHVLGDALGSIIVIISVLIIYFVKESWTVYVDPSMSILMVLIILKSSVPLLKESSMILLQTVPTHIQLNDIKSQLLGKFPPIVEVHDFHVWQLAGSKIIASLHIKFSSPADYIRVSESIKLFFHNAGIHSTTIQPEFLEDTDNYIEAEDCLMGCVSQSCLESTCCKLQGRKRHPKATGHLSRPH